MRKHVKVFAVLAVVALSLSTASMAAETYAQSLRDLKLHQLYWRAGGLPPDPNPVGMPGTNQGNNGGNDGPLRSLQSSQQTISDGPVSLSDGSPTSLSRGSVLVSPTGGSVYSPKQRADREIKGLIRKLG